MPQAPLQFIHLTEQSLVALVKHTKCLEVSQALESKTIATVPILRFIKEALSSATTMHTNIEL